MADVIERPYQESDAPAIAGLFNDIETHTGGDPGWMAEDIATACREMVRDTDRNVRVIFDADDDALLAVATVAAPPAGGFRVDGMGGVHPRARGRGLGRDLLSWQLRRAGELYRTAETDRDWELHAGAPYADESARHLYERAGMTPGRHWFEMAAPTTDVPDLSIVDGLRIEPYRPEFEAEVHRAHTAAFADHWGYQARPREEWVALTVGSATFIPELSIVAFDGDRVAGYVLSYRHNLPDELYVGQVGVIRDWRRKGLAAGLLSRVLKAAEPASMRRATLGVDADSPTGAVSVYERVGFRTTARAVTYVKPLSRTGPA